MTYIHARQALTSNGWQENVIIQIDTDGHIAAIHDGNIETTPKDIDHNVGILLPALSNLHSHSFQRAMAGLAETRGPNAHDDFWTWRKVMYRFLEILSPDDIQVIATQVQMEMLEAGYAASAEFHYLHHGQGGQHYDVMEELSLRHFNAANITGIGYTHLPVLYMQGGLDGRALAGGQLRFGCDIDNFTQLFSNLSSRFRKLPNDYVLGVAPHSLRAVSHDGLNAAINLSDHTPIHIHAAEQVAEIKEVETALGSRPIRWILDHMPVDERWCFIHATHMQDDEIDDLAASGAVAGLCPMTEANLGDGIFAAKRYLSKGGRIGIGADSNIKISLSEELRMLETSQRLRDLQRVVLSDEDTPSNGRYLYSKSATGGAQALGRNSGTIEVGKLADMVALDDSHYAISSLKADTVLDTWVFACDDNIISDVWSAGRHNVRDGRHINHTQITSNFTATINKLRQAL